MQPQRCAACIIMMTCMSTRKCVLALKICACCAQSICWCCTGVPQRRHESQQQLSRRLIFLPRHSDHAECARSGAMLRNLFISDLSQAWVARVSQPRRWVHRQIRGLPTDTLCSRALVLEKLPSAFWPVTGSTAVSHRPGRRPPPPPPGCSSSSSPAPPRPSSRRCRRCSASTSARDVPGR